MKILGFNVSVSRQSSHPVQKSLSLGAERWLRGEELPSGQMLSNAYEQVVWVYRAINALAEGVANVPFLFSAGERGRENLITSGPLLDFYARPHPLLNRFQYWELRVLWLMLRGECFRIPIYEAGRERARIKHILLPDPTRFQHIVEDHQLIGWRYTGLGPQAPLASQVFLPEEVWFERLPNPFDFWRGLPPLYVAAAAAQTDFAASAFMRGIIENNGDTGVIVRTDKWLSDEQREQILAALRDRKRKAGQADRPVLLLGSVEVIKPQLSSSDLQFLENRKFSRAEICAAFGVPEEIVTTTDHSKYDVMAGARLNFIENRIAPLCSRLEAEEDSTVKQIDPLASGWFDLDSLPILQDARRNRLVAARTGFEMGVPFNELNRVLDLGFRPLPWGNRGYLSTKLQEVGTEEPVAGPRSLPSHPLQRNQVADSREVEQSMATVPRLSATSAPDDEVTSGRELHNPVTRAAQFFSSLRSAPPLNPSLLRKLRRFFFEQRCRTLAKLVSRSANPDVPLLDLPAENTVLTDQLRPVLEAELASLIPNLSAEAANVFLANRQTALVGVNTMTSGKLQDAVERAAASHESSEQLAARIKAIFNEACDERAEVIAREEADAILEASQEALENLALNPVRTRCGWASPEPRSAESEAGSKGLNPD